MQPAPGVITDLLPCNQLSDQFPGLGLLPLLVASRNHRCGRFSIHTFLDRKCSFLSRKTVIYIRSDILVVAVDAVVVVVVVFAVVIVNVIFAVARRCWCRFRCRLRRKPHVVVVIVVVTFFVVCVVFCFVVISLSWSLSTLSLLWP